jgi:hypothetical protein
MNRGQHYGCNGKLKKFFIHWMFRWRACPLCSALARNPSGAAKFGVNQVLRQSSKELFHY